MADAILAPSDTDRPKFAGDSGFYGELRRHNYLAGPAKRRWILKERRNRAADELGTFRVAQIEDTCGQHRLGSDKTWVH